MVQAVTGNATPSAPDEAVLYTARHYNFLNQNPFHYLGLGDARELFFQPILFEEQLLVMKPQEVQDGRMPIGHTHPALDGRQAKFIGRAVSRSALDAGTGHPGAESVLVMVTARPALILIRR